MEKLKLIAKFSGIEYSKLEVVYNQVINKGVLTHEELRQFNEYGIPIIKYIKKVFDGRDNDILTMIRNRTIHSEDVKIAISLYYEYIKTNYHARL